MQVRGQFEEILEEMSAKGIGKQGETFDPNIHEAVGSDKQNDKPDNSVIKIIQRGWQLNEKVIRAAKVIINKK
jgi:molecular chaperone GrpE